MHSIFLLVCDHVKTQFKREIKCFQCDNGNEHDNAHFHKICELSGITFIFSYPHASQNTKAGRKLCTINNVLL